LFFVKFLKITLEIDKLRLRKKEGNDRQYILIYNNAYCEVIYS